MNRVVNLNAGLASLIVTSFCVLGCGGGESENRNTIRSESLDTTQRASGRSAAASTSCDVDRELQEKGITDPCSSESPSTESSEYDTSGDEYPDVRKVFMVVGSGRLARLVLICREADLNGDGSKDVVRIYNAEGRPTCEESDRNFDGRMDEITRFDRGRIVTQEMDSTADGRVDTKIFFENGRPVRSERDMGGRSTADRWQPDRWEYFENGRMVRMGTDLDGDGRVDRWDRDDVLQRQQQRLEREREAAEAAEAESSPESEDETDEPVGPGEAG